ncbi:MAG: hypothetical protein QOH31_6591, partial [Verrucomicrobiota bacterium]
PTFGLADPGASMPASGRDIERLHLRVQVAALFPEKTPLCDMVYESRFRRLRQQFRVRP